MFLFVGQCSNIDAVRCCMCWFGIARAGLFLFFYCKLKCVNVLFVCLVAWIWGAYQFFVIAINSIIWNKFDMAIAWHWIKNFWHHATNRFTLNFRSLSQIRETQSTTKKKKRMLLTNRIRNSCQELEKFPNCIFPVLNRCLSFIVCCWGTFGDKCHFIEDTVLPLLGVFIQMNVKTIWRAYFWR